MVSKTSQRQLTEQLGRQAFKIGLNSSNVTKIYSGLSHKYFIYFWNIEEIVTTVINVNKSAHFCFCTVHRL